MYKNFARNLSQSFLVLIIFHCSFTPMALSRRKTRPYLLQALYSRSLIGPEFSEKSFLVNFFDTGTPDILDMAYFDAMFAGVIEKEGELLAIIHRYAPKFDLTTMPISNLLPIMIAAYEMLYLTIDTIPEKVSINEAIELTKTFSDDSARTMVNGVLNALKNEKTTILEVIKKETVTPHFFIS